MLKKIISSELLGYYEEINARFNCDNIYKDGVQYYYDPITAIPTCYIRINKREGIDKVFFNQYVELPKRKQNKRKKHKYIKKAIGKELRNNNIATEYECKTHDGSFSFEENCDTTVEIIDGKVVEIYKNGKLTSRQIDFEKIEGLENDN